VEQKIINGMKFVAGHWPLTPDLDTIVFIHGSGGTSILWGSKPKTAELP
jgi:hypothetical protein